MSEYVIAKYLRLSLEDADLDPAEKEESNSISNQRRLIDDAISTKFASKTVKVIEFADDGRSGTNFDRPGVTKLLELAKQGKVNCIIVKDFSRWGRDYIAVSDYLEQIFPFLQIRFISVNDDYDSETLQYGSAGMVDVGFKNIMHDLYSKELSQKLRIAKQQLFAAGKYHSSFAFYGYTKSPTEKYKLIVDKDTAPIVRKIFWWADSGKSTTEIAKMLNDKKVPPPMAALAKQKGFKRYLKDDNYGRIWTSSSVRKILKDERYTGKSIYGRTKIESIGSKRSVQQPENQWVVVPDMLPVVISQSVYDSVQPKLKKHVKAKNEKTNRLFCGNVRCGHCGYALAYHPAKYPYYQCHTHSVTNVDCFGNRILEDELEQTVLTMAKKYAAAIIDADAEIGSRKPDSKKTIHNFRLRQSQLQRKKSNLLAKNNELFEALIDGKISDSDYREKSATNTEHINSLQAETDSIAAEIEKLSPTQNDNTEHKLLARLLALEHMDKPLVDSLIKSVKISLGGKIQIEWKFSCFHDIMNLNDDSSTAEVSNRVWLYYCSDDGWEELNRMRTGVMDCASRMSLTVIGESFDNAGLSITAKGFKEMQRAVRQGRVDKVIVPTLDGVAKTTNAYRAFEKAILKRNVKFYDMHGNLIIG